MKNNQIKKIMKKYKKEFEILETMMRLGSFLLKEKG